MGGHRIAKEEIYQIEALTEQGFSNKEIGEKLNRSPAAIRQLRYRKQLFSRAANDFEVLLEEQAKLEPEVKKLQTLKASLTNEVNNLTKKKQNLEAFINADKDLLTQNIGAFLVNLKRVRPDLFYMTEAEQKGQLLGAIMKGMFTLANSFK